ncbi:protein EPIDERMAL PATTERNING FACTOR 2 isoform X2 [Oryza sativa Japonica Group]|nr:protein EPIDERMAL PATTERNING FACTOR 2 isoform X2 [Oryza sativa Japonica Group]
MRRFSAMALAFAVVVMSSCVADGVRTIPGVQGSAGGLHNGGTAPSAAAANGSTTTAYDDRGTGGQTATFQVQQGAQPEEETTTEMGNAAEAATGSRLPDCTHACGPCSPCRRVMVSLRCAEAAESCPVAYRCMCRGRFFRVPTL